MMDRMGLGKDSVMIIHVRRLLLERRSFLEKARGKLMGLGARFRAEASLATRLLRSSASRRTTKSCRRASRTGASWVFSPVPGSPL